MLKTSDAEKSVSSTGPPLCTENGDNRKVENENDTRGAGWFRAHSFIAVRWPVERKRWHVGVLLIRRQAQETHLLTGFVSEDGQQVRSGRNIPLSYNRQAFPFLQFSSLVCT
ncbi:hypothetical protein HZ326_2478 [Fusarium oxysporum f. sp. albedinis]|nr:hypothetical protein HZ326_2478 [Fusarium oxysporum f. sp. albedinis]